jgi:hypothetical protein
MTDLFCFEKGFTPTEKDLEYLAELNAIARTPEFKAEFEARYREACAQFLLFGIHPPMETPR